MPDIWMDVDAALSEVPVNKVALIDDTDFKTREESVVYNQAGMDLVWNFVTTAGAYTQTAVTPTTAGDYDWANQGNGMYSIEIPASGGASINNDTEGFGWFTGYATGILPWIGPTVGFRAAALNNSLIDAGTTGLLAPTTAGRTLDVTSTGAAGIDWGNVENPTTAVDLSGTDIQLCDTVTTNTDMRGTDSAATATALATAQADLDTITGTDGVTLATSQGNYAPAKAGDSMALTAGAVDAVWDEATTGHVTAGTFGVALKDTLADTNELQTNQGNWLTATGFSTHSAADVWAVATRVLTAGTNIQLPSNGLANVTAWTVDITGDVTGNLSGSVGSVTGAVGSVTGNVGGNVAGSVANVTGGINTAAGTITTLDGLDTAQDTQHSTTQGLIGSPSDFGSGTSTLAANLEDLADNGTATYDRSTDSLQAIRDRGDAAWTTGGSSDVITIASGTIGATGNDTTHLHLTGLSYGDNELNNYLIRLYDDSAAEYHSRWIEGWADTGDLATIATLPFTPESSVDTYAILAIRRDALDVSFIEGVDATDQIRDAVVDDATKIDASALNTASGAIGSDGTGLTEAGGDGDHLTAINLPDQTMNITGNITGNLSGSVGSVTGNINTAAGTIQTLDALDTAQDTQHSTTQGLIGTPTDLGGGATLADNNADMAGATFSSATDSQEAIRDRGDAAWTTGAGSGLTPIASGTAQAGTASTIQLATGESFGDDILNGAMVFIHTGTGAGQSRIITDYVGATDTATITPDWTTNPSSDSQYEVWPGSANISAISGVAVSTSSAQLGVNVVNAAGTAWNSGSIGASTLASDTIGAAKIASGAITSAKFASGAITSTVLATDCITSDEIAASAVSEIQSGLATSSALATAQSDLDTITGTDGVTLATTQGNYAPAKAGDSMALTAGAVDAVWDEATSGHVTAGTFGVALKDTLADTNELQTNQGNWITATGFSTHSAADVWAVATRVLTAGTNIQLPSNGLANVTAWTVDITGDVTGNLSGSVGSVTGAVGSVTGNVGGSIGSLGTTAKSDVNAEVDTALADYDGPTNAEMVARTPAASSIALLEAGLLGTVPGAAVTGTLSTTQMTTDLAETTDDHYNGRTVIFTSGVLDGQATVITDYTGSSGLITMTALTEAPGNNDTFVIV